MKHRSFRAERVWRSAIVFPLCLASLAGWGCTARKVESQAAQRVETVPVVVAKVVRKTAPVELRAIGNVEAYSTVSVKSQVEGQLESAHFREGQDVKKGDLLFTIDRRPFEAALKQAEATLARDVVQATQARADAERHRKLFEQGILSKEQFDQSQANSDALEAAVRADQAAAERARIQLGYCTLRSPLDGRTGSLIVHEGNVVKANDASLVVINQITPIYVDFSVPEKFLSEIKRHMATHPLPVTAAIPGQESDLLEGTLSFVDNSVDAATGTIRLKGTFGNPQRRLWPGQFVNVKLELAGQPDAILVPSQAVQTGQQGQFVFVIKPDSTAEVRPVVVDRALEGETVIEKGLRPGEEVVTDGQLRLFPGVRVEIKNQ